MKTRFESLTPNRLCGVIIPKYIQRPDHRELPYFYDDEFFNDQSDALFDYFHWSSSLYRFQKVYDEIIYKRLYEKASRQ